MCSFVEHLTSAHLNLTAVVSILQVFTSTGLCKARSQGIRSPSIYSNQNSGLVENGALCFCAVVSFAPPRIPSGPVSTPTSISSESAAGKR